MPQARSHTAAGAIATNKESLSSASQLGAFGVRLAKFTHRFSADGGADFASGITLPAACTILSVSANVSEVYTGAATLTVAGEALDVSSTTGVVVPAVPSTPKANPGGELTAAFDAPATAGECTVAVAYIDLSEIK